MSPKIFACPYKTVPYVRSPQLHGYRPSRLPNHLPPPLPNDEKLLRGCRHNNSKPRKATDTFCTPSCLRVRAMKNQQALTGSVEAINNRYSLTPNLVFPAFLMSLKQRNQRNKVEQGAYVVCGDHVAPCTATFPYLPHAEITIRGQGATVCLVSWIISNLMYELLV